jgi:hypothetical protein
VLLSLSDTTPPLPLVRSIEVEFQSEEEKAPRFCFFKAKNVLFLFFPLIQLLLRLCARKRQEIDG